MDELHERASKLDIKGRSKMTDEELEAAIENHEALAERAKELGIKGRTKMDSDELAAAIVEAESESGALVPGEMYPHTPAIPPTGEGDMGYSPAPENLPSVPSIELPSSVHDHSGGTHTTVSVPVDQLAEADA